MKYYGDNLAKREETAKGAIHLMRCLQPLHLEITVDSRGASIPDPNDRSGMHCDGNRRAQYRRM